MIKNQLNDDVKSAMLAGEALRVETLRGLKSAILYAEVAAKRREDGLSDDEILVLFAKESKKRQESATIYVQGGSQVRADKELAEKAIIDAYLPAQLTETELRVIIDNVLNQDEAANLQQMGRLIGAVKARTGTAGDGGLIAKLVKENIQRRMENL